MSGVGMAVPNGAESKELSVDRERPTAENGKLMRTVKRRSPMIMDAPFLLSVRKRTCDKLSGTGQRLLCAPGN